jgi:nickel-dependent lactate racemase
MTPKEHVDMVIGKGYADRFLAEAEVQALVSQALGGAEFEGKRILVLMPDHTRTCPLPLLFRSICDTLSGHVRQLDFMVALGTHPPLPEETIHRLVGITDEEHRTRYPRIRFFNHQWQDPGQLAEVGRFTEDEIAELSGGLFRLEVPVVVNKHVLDYDLVLILGPVFPHEVVGFSGGNKYLFPGVAGERILHGGAQGRSGRALLRHPRGGLVGGRRSLRPAAHPLHRPRLSHRAVAGAGDV